MGSVYHHTVKVALKPHSKDQHIQMGVLCQKHQQEGFDAQPQRRDRATKSVTQSQYHN